MYYIFFLKIFANFFIIIICIFCNNIYLCSSNKPLSLLSDTLIEQNNPVLLSICNCYKLIVDK